MNVSTWGYLALIFFIVSFLSLIFFIIYIQNVKQRWALWTGFAVASISGFLSVVCFIVWLCKIIWKVGSKTYDLIEMDIKNNKTEIKEVQVETKA